MSEFPVFDEIHVISDIHMGGKPGFQILRETQRLAHFILRVAEQNPGLRVALVLNGDVFDTLAEDIGGYIAVDNAVTTVERIMTDSNFAPVWEALKTLVHADQRSLIMVIGNHDIEMAFPTVQRLILDRLSDGDGAARARIEFAASGAGFTCLVGKARVFCTHGNEVDSWNFNRYEELSKVARRINSGRTLAKEEWTPNAGTRMVKEVMNEVKKKYAWIDLLKPETSAAIGTLLAIDPSQLSKISRLPGIVGAKVVGSIEIDQRLSADGMQPPTTPTAAPSLESLLGSNVLASMGSGVGRSANEMLYAMESGTTSAVNTLGDAPLGIGQLIWDRLTGWLTGVGPEEALRRALLDWLKGDKTFAIDDQDDTFKEVVEKLGPSIDFTVTGHTHLERAIAMGAGRYYFNSGTWIRLMRFTEAMLADRNTFQPVFDVLKNGQMSTLDTAVFAGTPLVLDQTTAVSISVKNGTTIGCLNHVTGDGRQAPTVVIQFP